MQTQTLKHEAMESLRHLPDDVDIDEIMYHLYVVNKLHKSREAIEQGQVVRHNDLKSEVEHW
ncbi:MAG: hypothetical protein HQM08_24310 [Candidatus Riflebacteria bacterium]|nr:hypothetical protein [Candidatus Riflebacteria bacterium]